MSEDRARVTAPRSDGTREWEVFVREDGREPLRHAGSVTAPSAEVAHEAAASLFDHAATTVWCAPSDAVARFTVRDLGADYRGSAGADGGGATDEATTAGAGTTAGEAAPGERATEGEEAAVTEERTDEDVAPAEERAEGEVVPTDGRNDGDGTSTNGRTEGEVVSTDGRADGGAAGR